MQFFSLDVNKMFQMDDRLAMVVSGAPGDTTTFGELIQRNVQLYKIRHGKEKGKNKRP